MIKNSIQSWDGHSRKEIEEYIKRRLESAASEVAERFNELLKDAPQSLDTLKEIADKIDTLYTKPETGIPATDLAEGVIPTISTDITTDGDSDTKTASSKAVKTYVDESIPAALSAIESEIETVGRGEYVTAWDGASTPVVADIPAGVSVTYNTTSYTGELAASDSTMGKIYLVSTGTTDEYDRYVTVRSGSVDSYTYSWSSIGSTSIQLSDYATKAEVSQLGQNVAKNIFQIPYIYEGSVDITANWTEAVTGITFDAGYRYIIKVTVPTISNYVVVILAKSDNTEIQRVTASSAGTVGMTYTPTTTEAVKIRFYSSVRPTGVLVSITKAMELEAVQLQNNENAASPEIWAAGYRIADSGALSAYADYAVAIFPVLPGKKVLVNYPTSIPNTWVKYAFYSSPLASNSTLVGTVVKAVGNNDDIYGFISVPATATHIAITCAGYSVFPSVTNYIPTKEYKSIFENYWYIFSGRYLKNGAITSSSNLDLRLYFVSPGEKYRVASAWFLLSQANIVGFYSKNEIIPGNLIADELSPLGTNTGTTGVDHIYTVPAGAYVMAVSCLKATPPKIEKVSDTVANTVFDYNPLRDVQQKVLQMKYRSGRDTAIESEGMPNLCLGYFSDIHGDAANAKRFADFVRRYEGTYRLNNYRKLIDGMLCGGDMQANQYSGDYSFWTTSGLDSCLPTIGNHDAWTYPGPAVESEHNCYEKYIEPFLSSIGIVQPSGAGENGYYPCYYYKDYPVANIRLVVIDCMHWGANEDTPGTQATWLSETLAAAKTAGMAVLVVSHYPPTITFDKSTTFCDIDASLGAVLSNDVPQIVQEFIDGGGEFICWLSGHTHNDAFGKVTAFPNQVCLIIGAAGNIRDMAGNVDRAEYTSTQDCFNIMAFDTANKYIKVFRVGIDRDSALRHKGAMCYDYATQSLIYND